MILKNERVSILVSSYWQSLGFGTKKKFILLRHDIDFCLDPALDLAKLEKQHNIKSTYFILLHSTFYNSLSSYNALIIQQISKLGHEIGLHYDTNFLPNSDKKFEKLIEMEANLLGNLINKKITSIAQHNPTISRKRPRISNFLDANSADVIKEMTYISDSNQHWRRSCMCNHIFKINKLQINTHPVWWRKKPKSHPLKARMSSLFRVHSSARRFEKLKWRCGYLSARSLTSSWM